MSEEAKPNLRHKAVALEYSDKQELPKISAKGAGYIAERILKLAEEHEVPIAEHTGLVDALSQLQVGVEMDSDTAKYLVEALCFLYHIEQEFE